MPRLLLLCLLLAWAWPASALRLAVLSEAGFPHNALGDAKALSATEIGQYLDRFGDVSVLNYDEASRPDLLSPDLFDVFVVPYGGNYPLYLLPNLLHFCERGGDLILAEGAPFSVPYEVRGGAWMPVTVSRHDMGGMYYEGMRLLDFRDFGLFAYRVPPQLRLLEYGELRISESYDGYLVGAHTSDRLHQDTQVARNFPLLTARDKYGEVSGSAATLVRHFAGQFQDSTWIILGGYGKTSPLHPAFKDRDRFWAETLTCLDYPAFAPAAFDLPGYLPGERASCQLKVRSSATTYVEARLRLSLVAEDGTELTSSLVTGVGEQALRLAPRATATFAASFTVPDLTNQFITLTATLSDLSGHELDTCEVACWVLGETPEGPELSITSPFFELDKRPRQVFGINYSGPVDGAHLGLASFNLASYKHDLEHFRQAGVPVISLFSHRYDAGQSADDLRNLRLDLARMAAAKREGLLVKFITLDKQVIWSGEGYQSWLLDSSFLTRQGDVLAGYASQWRNVLFDITSEAYLVQRESALLRGAFQDWLADHYTNPAEALERWGLAQESAPTSFAGLPVPDPAVSLMGDNWCLNLATVLTLLPEKPVPVQHDYFAFSASVYDRFYSRLRSALGPAGKGQYLTGLSMSGGGRAWPWDTAGSLDVPNSHLYDQLLGLAGGLALDDFRSINKPFFAGELGYYDSSYLPPEFQLTSFSEQQRGYYEEAITRALMRQTAGLLFWELHDGRNEWQIEKGVESDYGLVSKANEVPKAGFWAVRNANLLGALTTPRMRPPQAVLVLPMELINSSYWALAMHRLRATANCLMASGLDFWTVPSTALASIPSEAKLVLCPLLWGLSDGEWAALRQLAESGKLVYVSGDVLRDEYLLARKPDRLADLKLGARASLFGDLRGLLTSAPVEVTPTEELAGALEVTTHLAGSSPARACASSGRQGARENRQWLSCPGGAFSWRRTFGLLG